VSLLPLSNSSTAAAFSRLNSQPSAEEFSALVARSHERDIGCPRLRVVRHRQVGGPVTRRRWCERHRNLARAVRCERGAVVSLAEVAHVGSGDAYARDRQQRCARVGNGHIHALAVALLHRAEVDWVRVERVFWIDDHRREAYLLRTPRSVVEEAESVRARTDLVGIEKDLDLAGVSHSQRFRTRVLHTEHAAAIFARQGDAGEDQRSVAGVLHRDFLRDHGAEINVPEVHAGRVQGDLRPVHLLAADQCARTSAVVGVSRVGRRNRVGPLG